MDAKGGGKEEAQGVDRLLKPECSRDAEDNASLCDRETTSCETSSVFEQEGSTTS